MSQQIRILLDAARYRLTQYDQFGDGYGLHAVAQKLVDQLENALEAALTIEANSI